MLQLRDPQKAPVAPAEEDFCTGGVLKTRFWQETGKIWQFYKKKKKADTELNPKSNLNPNQESVSMKLVYTSAKESQRQTR